ncbi:MAG: hypothetical protein LBQ95_07635 [Lachnospiraceae bacterium]|jgi:hypothetical protein|nr:hypothetical protein [Lachnospiraceae bacterium]
MIKTPQMKKNQKRFIRKPPVRIGKILAQAAILLGVFVVSVIFFELVINQGRDSTAVDIGEATYPQISFTSQGADINLLSGYGRQRDIASMHDSITPIIDSQLHVTVTPYGNEVRRMSYKVYSLDGTKTYLEGDAILSSNETTLDFRDADIIASEKMLEISLSLRRGITVYFYTRILDATEGRFAECISYINGFHENTLNKIEGAVISQVLEPNEEADNSSFGHVNIHSSYKMVTWGTLKPIVDGDVRVTIKELNATFMSATLEYMVNCEGDTQGNDSYLVREFYRVRYDETYKRMYLLNYDRVLEQIMDTSSVMLSEKGVLLGISGKEPEYKVNADGSVVSFVIADELWNYNRDADEISLVFGFRDSGNPDQRNMIRKHEIRILSMDEEGNTTFGVYGYMNRGSHEGEVGVAIYTYDIKKNVTDEKAFISSNKSYEYMAMKFARTVYYSDTRQSLSVLSEEGLFEITSEGSRITLAENLKEGHYAYSSDGRLIVYEAKFNDEGGATLLKVRDLSTAQEWDITCNAGEELHPLGFVKRDLVYGVGRSKDAGLTVTGEEVRPMYKVIVEDQNDNALKTYEANNVYILGAQIDENLVSINRAKLTDGRYQSITDEYITNNKKDDESNIFLEKYTSDKKLYQYRITFADGISDKDPKILRPKQALLNSPLQITFDSYDSKNYYYVYANGELLSVKEQAGVAINEADEASGLVITSKQEYVWIRGVRASEYAIIGQDQLIAKMASKMKAKEAPLAIANEYSDGKGMDLTGCTPEELYYILNQNTPVIAMTSETEGIILTGYTQSIFTYVSPKTGESGYVPIEELPAMTASTGNAYIGMLPTDAMREAAVQ